MEDQIFAKKTTIYREILPFQTFLYIYPTGIQTLSFFFFVKKFVLRKNSSQFFPLLSERFIYTMIKWKFPSKMIYKVVQEWRIDKVNFALSKRHKNKNVRHREYRSSIRFMLSLVFALHSCHAFIVAIMGHDGNLIGVFVKRKCEIAIAIHYNSFDNSALFLSLSLFQKKKELYFNAWRIILVESMKQRG